MSSNDTLPQMYFDMANWEAVLQELNEMYKSYACITLKNGWSEI